FAPRAQLRQGLLDGLENRVVPAAWTPPDLLVRGVILGCELGVGDGRDRHILARIAAESSATLKGFPSTLFNPSAGTRYAARKSCTSCPVFISGTSTRSKRFSRSPRFAGNGFR